MSLTSLSFFIFLTVVSLIYFLLPKKFRWIELLAASYAFYLIASPKTFVFVLFTTLTTFWAGKRIGAVELKYQEKLKNGSFDKTQKKALKALNQKNKRKFVVIVLLLNFGVLAVVKYLGYFLEEYGSRIGLDSIHFNLGILIPLGISFYTFQSMGYIIDVYRGKVSADTNLAKFALFVSFFPQMVQGPISRYDQLAGQLYEGHDFNYNRVKSGVQLILWGLFKKLVVADRAAIFVNVVFDNYTEYQGFYVLLACLLYTVQIYGDFSGGIDVARGAAQILGIDMTQNFNRPYFATTIPDFWRRWHMTLGSWCRDYIFYPLSLSKRFGKIGKTSRKIFGDYIGRIIPVMIAQLITFITIGVWHGANFKHVAYGLYHGVFIILAIFFAPWIVKATELLRINTKAFSWKIFQIIRTFIIVFFGRFFTRAADFGVALYMIKSCFTFNPGVLFSDKLFQLGLTLQDFQLLAICIVIWFIVSLMQENGIKVREKLAEQNILFRWIIYLGAVSIILIFGTYGVGYDASTFIYRGF